jgi:hypothetical protein
MSTRVKTQTVPGSIQPAQSLRSGVDSGKARKGTLCISMRHVETDEDVFENARLGDLPVS